jgi:hypothetical protein
MAILVVELLERAAGARVSWQSRTPAYPMSELHMLAPSLKHFFGGSRQQDALFYALHTQEPTRIACPPLHPLGSLEYDQKECLSGEKVSPS